MAADGDLRAFVARCEAEGQLSRIAHPVSPIDQLAAVTRESLRRGGADNRALLFERLEGYEDFPAVVNLFTSRRRCYLALGTGHEGFHDEYLRRVQRPLPPVAVSGGPCKEVIRRAGACSLLDLPVPRWHAGDGGRFITAGCCITRDPETGRRNVGIYRNQVFGDDELGILTAPYREIVEHARKAWARGERLPVAIVVGVEPAVFLAVAAEWPRGVDEFEMAGALRQAPLDLVPCETIPLEVPATAEIVIEGELDPAWTRPEGPFGEFTGYYGGGGPQPYLKVKAITHRRQPLYDAATEGRPPSTSNVIGSLQLEAEIRRLAGVPGLVQVHVCPGSCRMLAIAQIDKRYEGQGKAMGLAILAVPFARLIKTVIVVDRDVDPFDWAQVEWALATRFQPERDVEVLKDMLGTLLDPSLPAFEREIGSARSSKLVLDATQPLHVPYPGLCHFTPEVQAWVAAAWPALGLPY